MAQRRKRPAVDVKVAYEKGGKVFARIKIGSPWLAAGIAGVSAVAVLYRENPEGVRTAVTNTLADFGEVLGVRRGSVLVDVRFHTKERFLAFMDAVAAGTVKQRLLERFSELGLNVELELTVTVYESASQMGVETPKEEKATEEVSGSSSPPASLIVPFDLKEGTPSDFELQVLAGMISAKWAILGSLLNIPQDKLDEIDANEENKPYRMLQSWKYATTSAAPYDVLYIALCHETVGLNNLAKRFCLPFDLKEGTPSDFELQVLAGMISAKWAILGSLLNIPQDVLDEIDAEEENKPYEMLRSWKYARASAATYDDLYKAFCHKTVGLNNLAKLFCFRFGFEEGTLSDFVLVGLAIKIGEEWKSLGLRLNIPQYVLDEIEANVQDKPYGMLQSWKYATTSSAPYDDLCNALCHKTIGLDELAKGLRVPFAFKDGTLSDLELDELSLRIDGKWKSLGLCLNIPQYVLDEIEANVQDKPYGMLQSWKYATTSSAPYDDLYNALCHETVGLDELATGLRVPFYLKEGTPSDSELQVLAGMISAKWMMLGILLNIPQDVLNEIYTTVEDKPYGMLQRWKSATTSATPYEDLFNALCHERVGLKDLAKLFCFPFAFKDGTPSDSKLQVLAESIGAKWMILGNLLNIPQDVLDEMYAMEENKPYGMLLRWKYAATSATPYEDLYNALCHKRVGLNNLAKLFCCLKESPNFPKLPVKAGTLKEEGVLQKIDHAEKLPMVL